MDMHIETGGRVQDGYSGTKLAAWSALGLTILLMLFDYIDRQIVVSMLPAIKAEWSLSDGQLGGLVSIVSLTVAVLAIPIAIFADRSNRPRWIFAMAIIWSIATVACSYATDYNQLLALRGLVGIGEAGYYAVGTAILANLFPTRMRAAILATFAAAAAIGSVLGVVLGGVLAKQYGWHTTFGIVGFPGLILAFFYLLVRDTKPAATSSDGGATQRVSIGAMTRLMLAAPSAMLINVAAGFQLFVIATLFSWLPSFFNRFYGLPLDQAGIKSAVVLLLGSVSAIVWGVLADRVSRKSPRNKIWVMAACCLLSCVVLAGAFSYFAPGPEQYAMIILGGILMTGTLGTVSAVVVDVVHPGMRATAIAVGILIGNTLGLAAGPFVSGLISDRFGLATALAVLPAFGALAALAFALIVPIYSRDLQRASSWGVSPAMPKAGMQTA